MVITQFNLYTETVHDTYNYHITVEGGIGDLTRMNIQCVEENENQTYNSQGVDLTPEECEALGKHLLDIAARFFREQHKTETV
ncbi:MAG: hypothetical protein D3908_07570 [Candidatus Electrothrix sp. AUS4]|nr:hypothetical protein [Candidatus Electrothrix sp. AUS4]